MDTQDILITDIADPKNRAEFERLIKEGVGYFSHPYSGNVPVNMALVTIRSFYLYNHGLKIISPLLMTHPVADAKVYEKWLELDLALIDRCDYMILGGNWSKSDGCVTEAHRAQERGIPIYLYEQIFAVDNTVIF